MKKKIVISEKVTAVMLAAAMAISMTACGSPAKDMQGAAETAADEETSTVETAADRETSAVETVSEIAGNTTESTENAATDAEILVAEDPDTEITASNENTDIKVTVEDQKEEKKNDAGEVLVTISVQKATIEDSGYDALQKVLDQQSADTYELAQEAWGDIKRTADEALQKKDFNRLDYLSLAYLMTDNKEYADVIKEILLKTVEAESWGDVEMMARIPAWRSQLGMAHKSFLSAVGYDAAYNVMSSSERKKIAEGLKRLAVEPALGDWLLEPTRIHSLNSMGHNWWTSCVCQGGILAVSYTHLTLPTT